MIRMYMLMMDCVLLCVVDQLLKMGGIFVSRKVKVWGGIGEKNSNKDTQWYIQNRIYDSDGLCPALTTYKSNYWVCVRYEED